MPRDKSATHERLIPIIRKEFLELGYEKASLQHIANQAGITAAGLYRHFPGKEAMFASLVDETEQKLFDFMDMSIHQAVLHISDENFPHDYEIFRRNNKREMMEFVYDHYEELKLLLLKSRGTRYEHFEEELVEKEVETIKAIFSILKKKGIPHSKPSDNEIHILSTTFITAFTEAVKHDYTRKQAMEHLDFVTRLLLPGTMAILGF